MVRRFIKPLLSFGAAAILCIGASFSVFAAVNISDGAFVKDGQIYYDSTNGCAYMSAQAYIDFYTQEGSHYASSGKGSGSSTKTEWIVTEGATGKVWIPKGTTLETATVYLQNGYVVKRQPSKWETKEPDETKHNQFVIHDADNETSESWELNWDDEDNETSDSDVSGAESEDSGRPSEGGGSLTGNVPVKNDGADRIGDITSLVPGDIKVENGTISGSITVPGGKDYDFTLKPDGNGNYDVVTNYDSDSNVEFNVTATYEGEDVELEDYWYTFTGDNLDNALISASERHTDFGIGEKEVRKASFRKVLTIPGTWKIDSTYWEQLGIYRVYTVSWGPDINGNSGSTTVREKIDTQITSEPVRPQFPQYVPVPLVCVDCPPIEICVNGECDCAGTTNTVCSDTDREEAEKQLTSYEVNSGSVLEK